MAEIVTGDLYRDLDGQLLEIKRQLRQPSGYPYDPKELQAFLQRAIEGKFGTLIRPIGKTRPISVNYDLSLLELVAMGGYHRSDPLISPDNFNKVRSGIANVDIELVNFKHSLDTEHVLSELNKRGLRPAGLRELLTLGATYPSIQLNYRVVALWSVLNNRFRKRCAPALLGAGTGQRSVFFIEIDSGYWGNDDHFAAVRKAA